MGFTCNDSNFISRGIAYFTGSGKVSDITATHALLVTGPDECIEAHAEVGVRRASLSQYFNDETFDIFFRKPRNLTPEVANKLVGRAEQLLHSRYDFRLILAHALSGTILGNFLNKITRGKLESQIAECLNREDCWICSELVAYCLDQPPYKGKGVLKQRYETISPQELFEDPLGELFEPWHDFEPIELTAPD
jgi:hypothetical protein